MGTGPGTICWMAAWPSGDKGQAVCKHRPLCYGPEHGGNRCFCKRAGQAGRGKRIGVCRTCVSEGSAEHSGVVTANGTEVLSVTVTPSPSFLVPGNVRLHMLG